jgi:hypothetical protein
MAVGLQTEVFLDRSEGPHVGYPHINYEDQIELMLKDLEPYKGRISNVLSDATGQGDGPSELLGNSWLPVGPDTKFKFTMQSKNDLYVNFEQVLFKDEGDPLRFSYPADHPLADKFEEQMVKLVREYHGDGESRLGNSLKPMPATFSVNDVQCIPSGETERYTPRV